MTSWIDNQGDVWTLGHDGMLHSHETASFSPEHVERKWGPLVPLEPGIYLDGGLLTFLLPSGAWQGSHGDPLPARMVKKPWLIARLIGVGSDGGSAGRYEPCHDDYARRALAVVDEVVLGGSGFAEAIRDGVRASLREAIQ